MAEVSKRAGAARRRRPTTVVLLVLAVLALSVGFLSYDRYRRAYYKPYIALAESLSEVQRGIENFAVDSECGYPQDLQELIDSGYIDAWPENPFQPGTRMKPLRPNDPWEPGGFVYVAGGPVIRIESNAREHQQDALSYAIRYDEYGLVAYAPQGGSIPSTKSDYERNKAIVAREPRAAGIV